MSHMKFYLSIHIYKLVVVCGQSWPRKAHFNLQRSEKQNDGWKNLKNNGQKIFEK